MPGILFRGILTFRQQVIVPSLPLGGVASCYVMLCFSMRGGAQGTLPPLSTFVWCSEFLPAVAYSYWQKSRIGI